MEMNVNFYKETPQESIRDTIRHARQRMNYTQAQVAEAIGMSNRQYIKYENGQLPITDMSFQQGVNLCELLHLNLYQMVAPIEAVLAGRTSA
jgi:transcriptional regulator with XRE-family HTH domain